jgi:solute carrier family 25 citrate transporter 1
MAAHLVAGCFANAVGGLAWTPMDVIKQRLQVQAKLAPGQAPPTLHYRGVFHGISAILKADGPRGLLRGYWASLGTFGPFSAVYFAVLEELKGVVKQHNGYVSDAQLTVPQLMAVGATASACGAFVSGPMDLIKTRIQVYRTSSGGKFYGGTLDALTRTLREEGYRAFTKGLGARVMWLAPGSAITIAVYDRLKANLNSTLDKP